MFDSVLHGDETVDSDLDLLVEPTAQTTLMDIGAIRFELKQLLGMEVDVLTPNSLPASIRDQVLREAMARMSRAPGFFTLDLGIGWRNYLQHILPALSGNNSGVHLAGMDVVAFIGRPQDLRQR